MVAMRIVSPADKKRSCADFPHAINDDANRALGLFAFMRNEAIGQAEEKHILRLQPELRARLFRFLLAESHQSLRRIGFAVRMRAGAVADDDDLPPQSLPAGLGDQTAAGQALIVRMRRDNDERPIFERLTQRTKRKPMRGAQEFVQPSSPQILRAHGLREYPCRRVCQRAIRAGLAKIGCKVSRYALDRVRTQKGLEPD